ncbi:MAG: FecR domain-containing protein [Deltaproteobacteria bacterium]|nr:FecR domain-containing protein [Deltaproteobacteria bacterium]
MSGPNAACREARDPERGAEAEARGVLHRQRCPECQAWELALLEMKGALSADDQLDQLSRARIQSKLALSFDELAAAPAQGPSGLRKVAIGGLGLAAAILAGLWLAKSPSDHSLDVPSGGRAHLRVGPAFLSLAGPSNLRWPKGELEPDRLYLDRGRALIEVEHRPARGFVVVTPRVEVAVLGTLYAVEVGAGGDTAVDVRRGLVEVSWGERRWRIGAGEGWDEATGPRPIRPELDQALARHGRPDPEPPAQIPSSAPAPPAPEAELTPAPAPAPQRKNLRMKVPGATAPPAITAEQRYAEAEAALAAGQPEAATLVLEALVKELPNDPLADTALYELARIAHRGQRPAAAAAHLEELLARRGEPGLAEAAHHLLCRLHLEGHQPAETYECLVRFRRRFPGSGRDAEVLAALAGLAEQRGGCQEAKLWIDEYRQLYPNGPKAEALAARRAQCGP